jgi:peptidoglycan/LPS O-acetylase OafA/YrhL
MTRPRPVDGPDVYLPQLDGVRAIAVLLVLAQHWVANPFRMGLPLGFIGVTMFFVLSGYLISRILFAARERQDTHKTSVGRSLKTFYARRFLRIFPVYYLTILVLWVSGEPRVRQAIWWCLTYTVNFYFMREPDHQSIGHLWTLAIEEQYYLIYPLVVLLCTASRRRHALWIMCASAVASRVLLHLLGVGVEENKYFTLSCFDSFAMGGMLAHVEAERGKDRIQAFFHRPAVGAGIALIIALFGALGLILGESGSMRVVWFRSVISIASLYVIGVALVENRWLALLLGNRPIVYIGKISYGIYVYHMYSGRILDTIVPAWRALSYPLILTSIFATTMLVATASWFLFEKPINGLKRHFKY